MNFLQSSTSSRRLFPSANWRTGFSSDCAAWKADTFRDGSHRLDLAGASVVVVQGIARHRNRHRHRAGVASGRSRPTHKLSFEEATDLLRCFTEAHMPDALRALDSVEFRFGRVCLDLAQIACNGPSYDCAFDLDYLLAAAKTLTGDELTLRSDGGATDALCLTGDNPSQRVIIMPARV